MYNTKHKPIIRAYNPKLGDDDDDDIDDESTDIVIVSDPIILRASTFLVFIILLLLFALRLCVVVVLIAVAIAYVLFRLDSFCLCIGGNTALVTLDLAVLCITFFRRREGNIGKRSSEEFIRTSHL